jgi:hypothetical protein
MCVKETSWLARDVACASDSGHSRARRDPDDRSPNSFHFPDRKAAP